MSYTLISTTQTKLNIKTLILTLSSLFVLSSLHSYVEAADCVAANIRYAASTNRIYVTNGSECTLSEIKAAYPKAALDLVDPTNKIWLLRSNLHLESGAKLNLKGASAGGDVNYLRLQSNPGSGGFIYIRADWGAINIENTRISSWNTSTNNVDTNVSDGRAFIHVRSQLSSDGVTPLESRMDILNSDIGYLGYYAAESYGLTWKVSGTGIPNLYDKVNVLGDVKNSRLHHNYFGAYTYGAYGMQWIGNEIDNNIQYGLDPHDDSDSLVIEGNNAHHNGNHGIICSQRCDNLIIRNNKSHNNVGTGLMLHRNTNQSLVENNEFYANQNSGIAIFDSHDNVIRNNKSYGNRHGIRFSVGSANNLIENNNFSNNLTYGIYFYKGSDAPTAGDGRPKNNRFVGNIVNSNNDFVVKAKETDGNVFENNQFHNNAKSVQLDNAKKNTFKNNTFNGTPKPWFNQINGSSGNIFIGNK